MGAQDHYEILELSRQCTSDSITAAYRRLARLHHPDKNPGHDSTAKFQKILQAYETLSDPDKKRNYDYESGSWRGGRGEANEDKPDHDYGQHQQANDTNEIDEELLQQILEEILKRERSAQQYGNVIHKRLHGPHPWAILWKSSFWLVSVCVAYHMFMYAQYLVSGSAVIWGLRALLTYIFYKVADFTIDRGLSWRSVMILGYTLGAYYLFLGIRERFSAGIMRFFAHWIAITFFVVAGAFSYAWFIFDDSVPWGHESFEGVSPDERFEAYQHFERERQERADAWARHGDPPQTERSARKNSWKQSERSKRRQNKGRKKKV